MITGPWRSHLFERLQQQIAATVDPLLVSLLTELKSLPAPVSAGEGNLPDEQLGFAVPLKIRSRSGVLSFNSSTTVFGSPVDITLQDTALETFFPLDDFTMQALLNRARLELATVPEREHQKG